MSTDPKPAPAMMRTFTSNAIWPKGTFDVIGNQTSDSHGSREAAQGVCDLLNRHGAGGDGQTFPLKTWIEEKPEAPEPIGKTALPEHQALSEHDRPTMPILGGDDNARHRDSSARPHRVEPPVIPSEPASRAAPHVLRCAECRIGFRCYLVNTEPCACRNPRSSAMPATLPTPAGAEDREALGRLVREVWIAWAKEQPAPKPSWLVPWEGLSEPDREVDRRIGERLAQEGARHFQPLREELARVTKERDDWKSCAERTDKKMLHEQADHNLTVDKFTALRTENVALREEVEKAKRMVRDNYDAANAYMEISTKVRGDLDRMTSDRDGLMAINEQHRKALTAAEARCTALEAHLHATTHHADWNDRSDAYTAAIDAVHPMEGEFDPELYAKALSMVSNRHEKYNLVNLVHWLLCRIAKLDAARQPKA